MSLFPLRIAYFAIALCPIAFLTSMAAMEVFSSLLFLAVCALLIIDAKQQGKVVFSRLSSGANIPIAGYFAVSLLGILLLVEGADAQWDAIGDYRWILLFYGYLYFLDKYLSDTWRAYIPLFACAVIALGIFAIAQFLFGWEFPKERRMVLPVGDYFRAVGFFNIPLTFAGTIGMSAFLLCGFCIACWTKTNYADLKLAGVSGIGALIGFAGVVVSLTRGAWLAAAATIVIGAGLIKRSWALFALIGVIIVGAIGYHTNETIQQRFDSIMSDSAVSNQHRKAIWSANWAMAQERPLLGFGARQNIDNLPAYYAKTGHAGEIFIGHAHNNFLQIWAGQGVFALAFYLWFCGYFLWIAFRLSNRTGANSFFRGIGLGSCFAQLYFHFSGLTECNFIDLKVNHLLIFIWALTLAAWRRKESITAPNRH